MVRTPERHHGYRYPNAMIPIPGGILDIRHARRGHSPNSCLVSWIPMSGRGGPNTLRHRESQSSGHHEYQPYLARPRPHLCEASWFAIMLGEATVSTRVNIMYSKHAWRGHSPISCQDSTLHSRNFLLKQSIIPHYFPFSWAGSVEPGSLRESPADFCAIIVHFLE